MGEGGGGEVITWVYISAFIVSQYGSGRPSGLLICKGNFNTTRHPGFMYRISSSLHSW